MLIEGSMARFDEIFEAFATSKCVLQDGEFLCRCGFEVGEGVGGAHRGVAAERHTEMDVDGVLSTLRGAGKGRVAWTFAVALCYIAPPTIDSLLK